MSARTSAPELFIEALGLLDSHFSGVGQYILGILRGMDRLLEQARVEGREAPSIKVLLPFDKLRVFRAFGLRHVGFRVLPFTYALMSHGMFSGKLPPLDDLCGRGVYLFTRFLATRLRRSPSMVVIYDLSYELHPQYCESRNQQFLSRAVPESLGRVDGIVTISQNARQELVDFYSLSPTDVFVATPAADQSVLYRRDAEEIQRVRQLYDIQDDYILTLSNLEPRKNLETVVDVYCRLPADVRERVGLLLVGSMGWKANRLAEKVLEKVEQGHNIMRPSGYVTDQHKPALLSGASMLVYPSHYEGFGIPPLEALACGTPVIAGANSSLPEVVGEAGRLVASDRPELLHEAILQIHHNLEQETERSRRLGPLQAGRFCWTRSAQVYLDLAGRLGGARC